MPDILTSEEEFLTAFGGVSHLFEWRLDSIGRLLGTAQVRHHFFFRKECTFCPVTALVWATTREFFYITQLSEAAFSRIDEKLADRVAVSADRRTNHTALNEALREQLLQKTGVE